MSKISRFALACALAALVGQTFAGPAEERVEKAFDAWNAAFNKGDAKGVASFYAKDAVVMPATHEVKSSPQEIEDFFAGLFKSNVTDHKLEPFRIIEIGNTMIVASKWSAHGKDDKGNPTSFGGLATHVFQKQADNSYKLKLHTFN